MAPFFVPPFFSNLYDDDGCIYSILHPEVEKALAEDDVGHEERPVHHNQGKQMSFARRRWK